MLSVDELMKLADEAIHAYAAWLAEFTMGDLQSPNVIRLRDESDTARSKLRAALTAAPGADVLDLPGWKASALPITDGELRTAMANATAARAYAVGADPKTTTAPVGEAWCREFARAVLNVAHGALGGPIGAPVTVTFGPTPPKGPCMVCGKSLAVHGSYPTCATHPFTDDANCKYLLGARCPGTECVNACAHSSSGTAGVPPVSQASDGIRNEGGQHGR